MVLLHALLLVSCPEVSLSFHSPHICLDFHLFRLPALPHPHFPPFPPIFPVSPFSPGVHYVLPWLGDSGPCKGCTNSATPPLPLPVPRTLHIRVFAQMHGTIRNHVARWVDAVKEAYNSEVRNVRFVLAQCTVGPKGMWKCCWKPGVYGRVGAPQNV